MEGGEVSIPQEEIGVNPSPVVEEPTGDSPPEEPTPVTTEETPVAVAETRFEDLTPEDRAKRAVGLATEMIKASGDSFGEGERQRVEAALAGADSNTGFRATFELLEIKAGEGDEEAMSFLAAIEPVVRIQTPDGRLLTISEAREESAEGLWWMGVESVVAEEVVIENQESVVPEAVESNIAPLLDTILERNIGLVENAMRAEGEQGASVYAELAVSLRLARVARGDLGPLLQVHALQRLRVSRISGINTGEIDALLSSLKPATQEAGVAFETMLENAGITGEEKKLLISLSKEAGLRHLVDNNMIDKIPDILQRIYGPDADENMLQETAKVDLKDGLTLTSLLLLLAGAGYLAVEGGIKAIK